MDNLRLAGLAVFGGGLVLSASLADRFTLSAAVLCFVAAAASAVLLAEHRRLDGMRRAVALRWRALDLAAHEMRTPLTAIHAAAQVLRVHRRTMEEARVDEFIGIIARRSVTLRGLIEHSIAVAESEVERDLDLDQ